MIYNVVISSYFLLLQMYFTGVSNVMSDNHSVCSEVSLKGYHGDKI